MTEIQDDAEHDSLALRAARIVVLACDQHGHAGADCSHHNHRRDVHYAQECLRALGIEEILLRSRSETRERRSMAPEKG